VKLRAGWFTGAHVIQHAGRATGLFRSTLNRVVGQVEELTPIPKSRSLATLGMTWVLGVWSTKLTHYPKPGAD
jgi:hypothetical protein